MTKKNVALILNNPSPPSNCLVKGLPPMQGEGRGGVSKPMNVNNNPVCRRHDIIMSPLRG